MHAYKYHVLTAILIFGIVILCDLMTMQITTKRIAIWMNAFENNTAFLPAMSVYDELLPNVTDTDINIRTNGQFDDVVLSFDEQPGNYA